MAEVTTEIPRTLRVLWGDQQRPGGPGLSRERIVAAGIALADADGIAALSMARLAERLGSAPMSLYRHVANKDELLAFMCDAAPGPPPELPTTTGWRPALELWAHALRGVFYAHPWMLQVTAGRPPLDPGQLAWLDRGLSALDNAGLSHRDRFEVLMTVLNYVRGEAQIGAELLRGLRPHEADYARIVAHFVTADRMPALAAASAAGIFEPGDGGLDEPFAFGLARILDGVNVMLTDAE
jgi:AcrR family transcriptional regulator